MHTQVDVRSDYPFGGDRVRILVSRFRDPTASSMTRQALADAYIASGLPLFFAPEILDRVYPVALLHGMFVEAMNEAKNFPGDVRTVMADFEYDIRSLEMRLHLLICLHGRTGFQQGMKVEKPMATERPRVALEAPLAGVQTRRWKLGKKN